MCTRLVDPFLYLPDTLKTTSTAKLQVLDITGCALRTLQLAPLFCLFALNILWSVAVVAHFHSRLFLHMGLRNTPLRAISLGLFRFFPTLTYQLYFVFVLCLRLFHMRSSLLVRHCYRRTYYGSTDETDERRTVETETVLRTRSGQLSDFSDTPTLNLMPAPHC